jgi:hypothetical protein
MASWLAAMHVAHPSDQGLSERRSAAGDTMEIDSSEVMAYYRSLQELLRHADQLIEFSHAINNCEGWAPQEALTQSIESLGTGGCFAHLSQEINHHPLWGVNDIEEIERISALSHDYRLACPTPALPLIWKKMAPAWSTAVLDFCAHSILHVMAGWDAEGLLVFGQRPPSAYEEGLSRLKSEPEKFVSSVCEHFPAELRPQLSVARVMLDREASWVYLEMLKSRIISETPDNLPIGDNSKLAKVEKALREMFREAPEMKQEAIAQKLRTLNLGINTQELVDKLRKLRHEGVFLGKERSSRK